MDNKTKYENVFVKVFYKKKYFKERFKIQHNSQMDSVGHMTMIES